MEICSDTQSSQRINRPLAVADSGLDVHKDTTAVSVAIRDPLCDMPVVEDFGPFANRPTQIYRLVETLGGQFVDELHRVYGAGNRHGKFSCAKSQIANLVMSLQCKRFYTNLWGTD